MDRNTFIEKANAKHNGKYNYYQVPNKELEMYDTVPIVCEKHGTFRETVYQHLKGQGCFECLKEELLKD